MDRAKCKCKYCGKQPQSSISQNLGLTRKPWARSKACAQAIPKRKRGRMSIEIELMTRDDDGEPSRRLETKPSQGPIRDVVPWSSTIGSDRHVPCLAGLAGDSPMSQLACTVSSNAAMQSQVPRSQMLVHGTSPYDNRFLESSLIGSSSLFGPKIEALERVTPGCIDPIYMPWLPLQSGIVEKYSPWDPYILPSTSVVPLPGGSMWPVMNANPQYRIHSKTTIPQQVHDRGVVRMLLLTCPGILAH